MNCPGRIALALFCLQAAVGCSYVANKPESGVVVDVPLSEETSDENNVQFVSATSEQNINWDKPRLAAAICRATYLAAADEAALLNQLGFSTTRSFDVEGLHGIVCSNRDFVVIAFRGTTSLSNWVIDADIRMTSTPQGLIHRGFYDAMKSLYVDLQQEATAQRADTKTVWVTGHSLGGALALAFACEASFRDDVPINMLITFGQPLVVSENLGKYVNATFGRRYQRFVDASDIVCRLLPRFYHAGERIRLTGDNFEVRDPIVSSRAQAPGSHPVDPEAMTEDELAELQDRIRAEAARGTGGPANSRALLSWLTNHRITAYESRIAELATRIHGTAQ